MQWTRIKFTPLHLAASFNSKDIAADLLQRRTDINAMNKDGNTPLHLTAINSSKEIAADLLQCGADAFALNATSDTFLDIASKSLDTHIFVDACQKVRTATFMMNKRGETVFHLAAANCIIQILQPQIMNNEKSKNNCHLVFLTILLTFSSTFAILTIMHLFIFGLWFLGNLCKGGLLITRMS